MEIISLNPVAVLHRDGVIRTQHGVGEDLVVGHLDVVDGDTEAQNRLMIGYSNATALRTFGPTQLELPTFAGPPATAQSMHSHT